jgi:hypothetical protein
MMTEHTVAKNHAGKRRRLLMVLLLIAASVYGVLQYRAWRRETAANAGPGILYPFDFLPGKPLNPVQAESAVLIVHAGFLDYDTPLPRELAAVRADTAAYGDYDRYRDALIRFRRRAAEKGLLLISAVEVDRFITKEQPLPRRWQPPRHSVLLITKCASGKAAAAFPAEGKRYYQDIEALFTFLRQNGIKSLYCAGELGWYDRAQALGDGAGCLTVLAQTFREAGFETIGIADCIFPLKAPPGETDGGPARLYEQTVTSDALFTPGSSTP